METLKKGDFFVLTGGSYPVDTWEVYGDEDPTRLSLVPMSGGPVALVLRAEITRVGYRKVDPESEPKQLRKARFALGHDNYDAAHEGYTFGDLWNGWECPYFTREVGEAIALEMQGEEAITYDAERDAFVLTYEPWGNGEPCPPEIFRAKRLPGVDVPVYAIGAWGWCWEIVEPPSAE